MSSPPSNLGKPQRIAPELFRDSRLSRLGKAISSFHLKSSFLILVVLFEFKNLPSSLRDICQSIALMGDGGNELLRFDGTCGDESRHIIRE
ncbi:hypothetical protein ES703_90631 [subsurface metagenome]